jgi:uncharacterized Fe-S center protein
MSSWKHWHQASRSRPIRLPAPPIFSAAIPKRARSIQISAQACIRALDCSREGARASAETFTWEAATHQFLTNVMRANGVTLAAE